MLIQLSMPLLAIGLIMLGFGSLIMVLTMVSEGPEKAFAKYAHHMTILMVGCLVTLGGLVLIGADIILH